ncbi:MAG TPA: hypothetical protein VJY62_02740, partial [Bacteroidia bacterium]|nr:hypothetical protein [Bacteroidia bacterium]
SKKKTYKIDIEKYGTIEQCFRIEKYYWDNNNIVKVEECDANEILRYEFFYTFDTMRNYKKNNPIYIEDPINWSENNVIEMNWNDYVGILELECRPCESTYTYNLDSYPVIIETNSGRKMVLTYE